MRAALLIATLGLLAGCTHKVPPPVGPWAYEFQLGTFRDLRPQDEAMLRASTPFTTQAFMTGWRRSVGRSVFGNTPAILDLVLKKYEITSAGDSYAIDMDVKLTGRLEDGRVLGVMNGKCNAISRIDEFAWWDFTQQARKQRSIYPLTAATRNATMWQKVMDRCVAELAKQFDTTLAEGVR